MTNTKSKLVRMAIGSSLAFFLSSSALVALAATTTPSSKVTAKTEARIAKIKTQADKEIDRRIKMMEDLKSRLGEMTKLSTTDVSTLANELNSQESALQNLRSKIDADTDLATIQADTKSITDSYRIFALVIPRDRIIAAADRLAATVSNMNDVYLKLQARLNDPIYASNDLTALKADLADIQSKLTDANSQAQAAINAGVTLSPDNGDKTVMASNAAALKTARGDIKTGSTDVNAAIKTAKTIRKALDKLKVSAPAQNNTGTGTSTSNGSANGQ